MNNRRNKKVGSIIQSWLFRVIFIALILSFAGVIYIQSEFTRLYQFFLIGEHVEAVETEIEEGFDGELRDFVIKFADVGEEEKKAYYNDEYLSRMVKWNDAIISEINIVDSNGIITHSSNPEKIGFDMDSENSSREFICLLNGEQYYAQDISFDDKTQMRYAGVAFPDKSGFFQVGISPDNYISLRQGEIEEVVHNRKIELNGFFIICDKDGTVIAKTDGDKGEPFEAPELLLYEGEDLKESLHKLNGVDCYVVVSQKPEYYVIGAVPKSETDFLRNINSLLTGAMLIIVLVSIFICLSKLLKKHVVRDIEDINDSLSKITEGDLARKVDVTGSLEFSSLSDGINKTVDKLVKMIDEADERVKQELEFAKVIQTSAVPNRFPPYPDQKSFGLYASMDTAKAVGGDFYDFFMRDNNTLVIMIADVSDKGMPAALFMMKAMTLIQTYAEEGLDVEKVAESVNQKLCEENEAGMFVTAWIGFMNIKTGVISYVHAGHTKPVITVDGGTQFVNKKKNFLLGGRKNIEYTRQEITLGKGEALFLYTDGVTEARNTDDELYGEERLLELLDKNTKTIDASDRNKYAESVCRLVADDVRTFADGAEQSDDITMLCLYRWT